MFILYRVVFRLDFSVSYKFMNSVGTAMQILNEEKNDFWKDIHEVGGRHFVKGSHHEEGSFFANISFEPLSINGSIELAEGTPLAARALGDLEMFKKCDAAVSAYVDQFGVENLNRCGIRFFITMSDKHDRDRVTEFSERTVHDDLAEAVNEGLGEINGAEIHLQGGNKEGIGYNLRLTPLNPKAMTSMFQSLLITEKQKNQVELAKFLFDLDLYEKNFSFRELSLFRWSKDKIALAQSFIDRVAPAFDVERQQ